MEFYIADAAGQEGQTFLMSATYPAPGNQVEMVTFAAGAASVGDQIVGTATDANGNTSEFSLPETVAAPLLAAGGPAPDSSNASEVTASDLDQIVDAAITRLADQGVTHSSFADVTFQIADLPRNLLATATGSTITIDIDAAGYGWFIDTTPLDDVEYDSGPDAEVAARIDLLTVVMHELGHLAGLHDLHDDESEDDFMYGWLAVGTRRTEIADHVDQAFADLAAADD